MKFTAFTEDQIRSMSGVLNPGIYDFEVANAEDTVSKNGNEMIKLTLRVFDEHGKQYTVYDYLIGNNGFGIGRIKTFCETVGLKDSYDAGELHSMNCVGRAAKVHLIMEKSNDPQYTDRLKVKTYLDSGVPFIKTEPMKIQKNNIQESIVDDDIPF